MFFLMLTNRPSTSFSLVKFLLITILISLVGVGVLKAVLYFLSSKPWTESKGTKLYPNPAFTKLLIEILPAVT